MTVAQIRTALGGVPDQQEEIQRVQILDLVPGPTVGGPDSCGQVLGVFFTDGAIAYFDENGKPVIEK